MAHSLADWSLASTITLNMVHKDSGMRKSVERLLLVSLDSNAALVLKENKELERRVSAHLNTAIWRQVWIHDW